MNDWAEPSPDQPGGGSGDPGDELVEWIDDAGNVIEVVTRRRMRAEGLAHRCTYVVVVVGPADRFADPAAADRLTPDTELVVHLRADWKDVAPSHWDLAFGGVCGVGEEWELSARRELAEEAGIELAADDPVLDLGPVRFVDPDTSEAGT
ncbi:MAG: NUDIX domain-containing protein, partial [Actinomycetota bacterium]